MSRLSPEPIGWPLLPRPEGGRLAWPDLDRSVRETIQVILSTRPGEQLRRPGFGAGLQEFLHQPNTLSTRARIRERVMESLERWEPRVALDRVEVMERPGRPAEVRVEIAYRLRRTGEPRTLGLTLELES
ncbi:MAG: GPW/gp25 family protein [Alphaproteobacteria bacterium]|nr:GPW/gp25 family protein [Alphaproteobacteria bacterium]